MEECFSDHSTGASGFFFFVKCGEFLEWLRDYQLFKKGRLSSHHALSHGMVQFVGHRDFLKYRCRGTAPSNLNIVPLSEDLAGNGDLAKLFIISTVVGC